MEKQWDCCVVGNTVSALWLSHWFWSRGKTVAWVSDGRPLSPSQAMLQSGWLWALPEENVNSLTKFLHGLHGIQNVLSLPDKYFELVYFDARSSRRFRKIEEVEIEWGEHEKKYFEEKQILCKTLSLDLWAWHNDLQTFHSSQESPHKSFQGYSVLELETKNKKLNKIRLTQLRSSNTLCLEANDFFLCDDEEYWPSLLKNLDESRVLAQAYKGFHYQGGFGLQFLHKNFNFNISQVAILPLVINPSEKTSISHIIGRFVRAASGETHSYWVGLLKDEELEDNPEILKKIKLAKKALDRAFMGFSESIQKEVVSFEPQMRVFSHPKNPPLETLGSSIITDKMGELHCFSSLKKIFEKYTAVESLPETLANGNGASDSKESSVCQHSPLAV